MLSALVEQHNQNRRNHKNSQERKRNEAISAANDLIQAIKDDLHKGLQTAEFNQKRIKLLARILASTSVMVQKTVKKLLGDLKIFATSLKELGDVEQWALVMEKEILEINFQLDNL